MGRIFVVGSANIDLVAPLAALPRAGETVAAGDLTYVPGGKGANQTCAAARMGTETHMIARTGSDHRGVSSERRSKSDVRATRFDVCLLRGRSRIDRHGNAASLKVLNRRRIPVKRFSTAALAMAALLLSAAQSSDRRKLSREGLRDKIAGGWAGQMIGVSFGSPTEFKFNQKIIAKEQLPVWKPEMVSEALDQDDLYVDMTLAKVLDEKGLQATTDDFGEMFVNTRYRLWHANLAARRALRRGVPASLTGTPRYNAHADDIDFQIESDFIGLMAPGLPQAGNELCLRAGRLMNTGDGLLGGMFVSGMYSVAFFTKDPREVVQAGLASLPPQSGYARIIRDVLGWSKQYPNDWEKVWALINDKWDRNEVCPEGALRPFNIDAKLNGAYIALGLLYGGGDFGRTLEVSTRAGQDSDCNPSNALGILGVMLGYQGIPEQWRGGIPAIADKRFNYTDFTFNSIVDSTEKRALQLVKLKGGTVENDQIIIKTERPQPLHIELWRDHGSPVERVKVSDPRWTWKGYWTENTREHRNDNRLSKLAKDAGSEATIRFDGTGAIVSGPFLPKGGLISIYLDGKFDRSVDVCSDEAQIRIGEALWQTFGLPRGTHTVRVVVEGKPGPGSDVSDVEIEDLIVFR